MSPLHGILIAVTAPIALVVLGCVVWERINPAVDEVGIVWRGILLCCASGFTLMFIGGFL